MKRRRKIALILAAVPTVAVAGLWVDTYSRAVAAIRAEEARLAKDIAAARLRRSPENPAFPFEEGHSRQLSAPGRRLAFALAGGSVKSSFAQALADLARLQDRLGEGGYACEYYRSYAETNALYRIRLAARDEEPEPAVAEALDRLDQRRPTLAEIVAGEHLLDRAEVLRVLRRTEDPFSMILRPPGWRELFSWRIHVARILRELDDHHREMQDLVARQKIPPAAVGIYKEDPHLRTRTDLRLGLRWANDREMRVTREWEQTRTALRQK
jgi:hypothetical protein